MALPFRKRFSTPTQHCILPAKHKTISGQNVTSPLSYRWPVQFALCAVLALVLSCAGALAQSSFGAQARLLDGETSVIGSRERLSLTLSLSQPVPFRVRVLAAPPRLVIDLNTVDWSGADLPRRAEPVQAVSALRTGHLPDGWARLVIDLSAPYALEQSEQVITQETGASRIRLDLHRVPLEKFEQLAQSEDRFAARYGIALLHPAAAITPQLQPMRKPLIMLDPGHGGIDPGAERGGVREADIVLDFARQLREVLLRRGHFDVSLTRDADVFISLDGRIRAARAAGADVFVSLHADALPEGRATGTVVYLLADEASDDSAAYLAERHDRADMLAGVDLTNNTDEIARVLMSVAWQDTAPRSRALAEALVEGVGANGLTLHRRPIQSGAFTVLRAVDMPSVLVELGFMSSPRDLANLTDPDWRMGMAEALADALDLWHARDLAQQSLRRQ